MNCPNCDKEMDIVHKDESRNPDNDKKYDRTVFMCEKCDIWTTMEVPQKSPKPVKKKK